ncbi:MAG: RdgB/HAM1 family non-canonical purine NTP pyrophosphatase [Leptospirales bacterium]|nr:RdgB/HAM1 family non-canonical purine NTP pyrophosphatase [Leptospirales bacterium]
MFRHLREELSKSGVLLASANSGKLREFNRILGSAGLQIHTPEERGLRLVVDEAAPNFAGNAILKAEAFAAASGLPTLADDSGLAVEALGGAPGVRSARYGGPGLDDAGRRRLLLSELQTVPEGRRQAHFVCALALAIPGRAPIVFEASTEGKILTEERGEGGFGYDSIFQDPESGRSYAELSPEEKDQRSHRGKALLALARALDRELHSAGGFPAID